MYCVAFLLPTKQPHVSFSFRAKIFFLLGFCSNKIFLGFCPENFLFMLSIVWVSFRWLTSILFWFTKVSKWPTSIYLMIQQKLHHSSEFHELFSNDKSNFLKADLRILPVKLKIFAQIISSNFMQFAKEYFCLQQNDVAIPHLSCIVNHLNSSQYQSRNNQSRHAVTFIYPYTPHASVICCFKRWTWSLW